MKYKLLLFFLFSLSISAQTSTSPALGDGSVGSPYQIATVNNLYWLTQNSSEWGKSFIQTSDIDANSASWDGGNGFSPIGNGSIPFTGSFNGQGFKIERIDINRSSTNNIGLFGVINNAELTNIFVLNSYIRGADGTAGLVGSVYGSSTINSCYSNGCTIIGTYRVGGLIGGSSGDNLTTYPLISCSYSSQCVIQGYEKIGGFIGDNINYSKLINCYSQSSNITLLQEQFDLQFGAGGLIGTLRVNGIAENCYSTSSILGSTAFDIVGGLIGVRATSSTVTNCFWDTQTSGQTTSAGGIGKTTAEMKNQSTYISWDFSNSWFPPGQIYPTLRCILTTPLPVELTTFIANVIENNVELNWETATEVNNYGFEIERASSPLSMNVIPSGDEGWENIAFVEGHGNSNSPKYYTFTDNSLETSGKYSYRLKQIDIDGKYEYSDEVEVNLGLPNKFSLNQNYPNPFNPATSISYSLPEDGFLTLNVYDMLGRQVASLEQNYKKAGSYTSNFDASNLTSGIYFYTIKAGSFTSTKKMLLMK